MKKILLTLVALMMIGQSPLHVQAQAAEAAQLALNIEKLAQFKSILTSLKKGFDIVSKGYGTVKSLTEGNFNIHKVFLDGLMEVSPSVKKYRKVAGIIDYQLLLVKEYKRGFERSKRSNLFNPDEINYQYNVYVNLVNSSLKNLDELLNVVTASKLRMSDDERLATIDAIYADMEDKISFIRSFNNSTSLLAVQRSKEKANIGAAQILNGINPKLN
jgi:hypothetical protein